MFVRQRYRRGAMAKRCAILIDIDRCIGCHACSLACKFQNGTPLGVDWHRVETIGTRETEIGQDVPAGTYPNLHMAWLPLLCMHCADPPCADVCPVGAINEREDGIVILDEDKCIGCRYCTWACPYGALHMDEEKDVVTKCHLCYERVDQGKQPACVEACVYGARVFGDVTDPDSEISRQSAAKGAQAPLAHLGTRPRVRYAGRRVR
jgi:DMSO reductase iron-sulfur subunit